MKSILVIVSLAILLVMLALITYQFFPPVRHAPLPTPPAVEKPLPPRPLTLADPHHLPSFHDDTEEESILKAIDLHLKRLALLNQDEKVPFGDMAVPRRRITATLELFRQLLKGRGLQALEQEVSKHFLIYQASGQTGKRDVLFTGYYEPILDARTKPNREYRYPLYKAPSDLQVLDLGDIDPRHAGTKIALRVAGGRIRPYFDRQAIDADNVLTGKGLELAYLKDDLDRYMLQVQGSGVLRLENDRIMKIGYAGTNHFPYVSLGKLLINERIIPEDTMSLAAIRRYYRKNPGEAVRHMNRNRRYIFFREVDGPVTGCESVELTPGRSIATDKRLFPGGGLAFAVCRKPSPKASSETAGPSIVISRFMLDQDTGSAIQGPGRVDIFWGTGDEAGRIAGGFKYDGELYYLLIKEEEIQD